MSTSASSCSRIAVISVLLSSLQICSRSCIEPTLEFRSRTTLTFSLLFVAEYGGIEPGNIHAMQSEIFARGPIKTAINAKGLENYKGGILGSDDDPSLLDTHHNHGVSIVGWGYDPTRGTQHWIIRNSWYE